MAKTRSMTRIQNHDDDAASSSSCSRMRFKTFDNCGVASWSNLNHDVLHLVTLQLGVVDFLAFSVVCKSWTSYALSNKEWFMASRLPMSISIDTRANKEDSYCYLEDSEGRRFKTVLPHSAGRTRVRLTCGYLVLFGRKTRDFWLVNPITRHELHFPAYPLSVAPLEKGIKAVLVFSPSISRFVFVVLHRRTLWYLAGKLKLSFYIEGKRRWYHVSSNVPIVDIHFFKGKIYTLHSDCSLGELRLNSNGNRRWTLLETNNSPNLDSLYPRLVSSGENLYLFLHLASREVMELDFGEMKWGSPEKTIREYAFFIGTFYFGGFDSCAAIKPESWAGLQTQYKRDEYLWDHNRNQQCVLYKARMWYFPHDCLNVSDLV